MNKKREDGQKVTRQDLSMPRKRGELTPKPKKVERLLDTSVQMYRTKMPVSKGKALIGTGELINLDWLDSSRIKQLIKIGAVRPVLSPPLSELAGWKTRAKRLGPAGVVTIADFLVVNEDNLARLLRVKKETVLGWQKQLREWSKSEEPRRH